MEFRYGTWALNLGMELGYGIYTWNLSMEFGYGTSYTFHSSFNFIIRFKILKGVRALGYRIYRPFGLVLTWTDMRNDSITDIRSH